MRAMISFLRRRFYSICQYDYNCDVRGYRHVTVCSQVKDSLTKKGSARTAACAWRWLVVHTSLNVERKSMKENESQRSKKCALICVSTFPTIMER